MRKNFFYYYYLRSMRLYYSFVTGTTTLIGAAVAHRICGHDWGWRDAVVLTVGYLAWGVNQIFSDWEDRSEDKINAPHRPMVSGKLSPRHALALSSSLMVIFAAASSLASKWSLLFLGVGGLLNLCYSLLKKIPVLNCLIYSLAITCCAFYGYTGSCGALPEWKLNTILPFALLIPAHVIMCSFSYYKDKRGDRKAGIRTLQNMYPDQVTLPLHWIASIGYTLVISYYTKPVGNMLLAILFALGAAILLAYLCLLLGKEKYHPATCWNCALCVCWLCFLLIPFFPWSGQLASGSIIMIFLLFRWYPDEKE